MIEVFSLPRFLMFFGHILLSDSTYIYIYTHSTHGIGRGSISISVEGTQIHQNYASGVISISNKSMFDSHLHLLYLQLQLHEYPYLCWHKPFRLVGCEDPQSFPHQPCSPTSSWSQFSQQEHGRASVRPTKMGSCWVEMGRQLANKNIKSWLGRFQRGIPPNGHQIVGRTRENDDKPADFFSVLHFHGQLQRRISSDQVDLTLRNGGSLNGGFPEGLTDFLRLLGNRQTFGEAIPQFDKPSVGVIGSWKIIPKINIQQLVTN